MSLARLSLRSKVWRVNPSADRGEGKSVKRDEYIINLINMENLDKSQLNKQAGLGDGKETLDKAIAESQERIKADLKSAQGKSADEYFKKIEVDSLNPESLMVFNRLAEANNIFPVVVLRRAIEEIMKDDSLFNEDKLSHEASKDREYIEQSPFDTPEEKLSYEDEFIASHPGALKEEIVGDPNKYYTEDLLFNDYGETNNQETARPDTRA